MASEIVGGSVVKLEDDAAALNIDTAAPEWVRRVLCPRAIQ
jgi:hypothetical protein